MSWLELLPLAVLLPLFPASMLFGLVERRVGPAWAKALLMIVWSQAGVALLWWLRPEVPGWLAAWALFTAGFYAFRALALNEATAWAAFLFVSVTALFWLLPPDSLQAADAQLLALAVVAPVATLVVLAGGLVARFGSAYLGLVDGLVHRTPRLSVLLALAVAGVMAAPPFPLFFVVIWLGLHWPPAVALGVAGVWYLWGWSGVRLLQRLVRSGGNAAAGGDLSPASLWAGTALFAVLAVAGVSGGVALVEVGR